MDKIYFSASDISEMLDVSRSKAYNIIKALNQSLEKQGYITLAGKVPKAYFAEHWYGLDKVKDVS